MGGPTPEPGPEPEPGPPGAEAAVPGPGDQPTPPRDDPAEDALAEEAVSVPTVEGLIGDLEAATTARDEYLEALRRTQADFENFRKRTMKQQADEADRAASGLADALLPVLDACDSAVRHGAKEVEPIYASMLSTLEKQGLERIDPAGEDFDPNRHEAVMHEPGEGEPTVIDVMRPGYAWKARILRAAMVKVRG